MLRNVVAADWALRRKCSVERASLPECVDRQVDRGRRVVILRHSVIPRFGGIAVGFRIVGVRRGAAAIGEGSQVAIKAGAARKQAAETQAKGKGAKREDEAPK